MNIKSGTILYRNPELRERGKFYILERYWKIGNRKKKKMETVPNHKKLATPQPPRVETPGTAIDSRSKGREKKREMKAWGGRKDNAGAFGGGLFVLNRSLDPQVLSGSTNFREKGTVPRDRENGSIYSYVSARGEKNGASKHTVVYTLRKGKQTKRLRKGKSCSQRKPNPKGGQGSRRGTEKT